MDADTIFLVLRVVVALGVVLAVLWILRRRLTKGGAAKAGARPSGRRSALFTRAARGKAAAVRGRHALGQKSSVAVVEFDGREFLLGVTEHGVTVLHEAGSDDAVAEAPVAAIPEPVAAIAEPVAIPEPVEIPEPAAAPAVAPEPEAAPTEPAPDWATLFARELAAMQLAMSEQTAADRSAALPPVAEPAVAQRPAPEQPATAVASDPDRQLVFAPRYARHGAGGPEADDEVDPASGLVPQPVPVRTLITGQFVAEVELMPLPTSAIPVVPTPQPPIAPAPAATPMPTLPTTAMIPTIAMTPVPRPAPVPATPAPAAATLPVPVVAAPEERPERIVTVPAAGAREPVPAIWPRLPRPAAASSSPLAGSILSPETWRQTVDAFRAMR